jgi:putative molybdopterin biosynthesis protein
MSEQQQFLNVIDRDEAERRFLAAVDVRPLGGEVAPLTAALGRVLAGPVRSPVDVPSFDRSNVDGYAVHAADTFGASEQQPRRLRLHEHSIAIGGTSGIELDAGMAIGIPTGGMLPRQADAVVMVEHTDIDGGDLLIRRSVTPGANVSFTGTDIVAGEIVFYGGETLTSRDTGVLAAIGLAAVEVVRQPRVAILSTGDELICPGEPVQTGRVYDSNGRILADAVRELGGLPVEMGIVADRLELLRQRLGEAIRTCDLVLLSGGTSKGAGDVSYRAVAELGPPGIIVHGVALKPGKPICLAAAGNTPVIVLPGFPTSAIFTFHEFVAPLVRRMAGLSSGQRPSMPARLAMKVNSEIGRTEYLLVSLVKEGESPAADSAHSPSALVAWPMGKGSGSVTAFSQADGFVTIDRHQEIVEEGTPVTVTLLGRGLTPADLVVIGSHCTGLDMLVGEMQARGFRTKSLAVGSMGGLEAVKRGQCDIAGVHLLDAATGTYNEPYLTPAIVRLAGYGRMQGIVFRVGDPRFTGKTAGEAVNTALADERCVMVNRNAGSGTRVLIDRFLGDARPPGHAVQPRNHNAVAAAVAQRRADWGVTIEPVARQAGLGFLPLTEERYDFLVPRGRLKRGPVREFARLLNDPAIRQRLSGLGFRP